VEQIKDTIQSVIRLLSEHKGIVSSEDAEILLKKALTKRELTHIKLNYFKKGILNLTVDSSSWLYNFNLHKRQLLAKLNEKSDWVKEIRFRIGEVK